MVIKEDMLLKLIKNTKKMAAHYVGMILIKHIKIILMTSYNKKWDKAMNESQKMR